jgi:hypothetical protein
MANHRGMEPLIARPRLSPWSRNAPKEASMHHVLMTATALTVFALGMSASMAQNSPTRVNPPPQPSPQMQTQPAPIPNLNTSKNPYEQKKYMETPTQPKK